MNTVTADHLGAIIHVHVLRLLLSVIPIFCKYQHTVGLEQICNARHQSSANQLNTAIVKMFQTDGSILILSHRFRAILYIIYNNFKTLLQD